MLETTRRNGVFGGGCRSGEAGVVLVFSDASDGARGSGRAISGELGRCSGGWSGDGTEIQGRKPGKPVTIL
jgi:hypothetical protein